MNAGTGPNAGFEEEIAVLFQACVLGRADIVKNSIASIKTKPNISTVEEFYGLISQCREEDGLSPLHIATRAGHTDVIRSLLVHVGFEYFLFLSNKLFPRVLGLISQSKPSKESLSERLLMRLRRSQGKRLFTCFYLSKSRWEAFKP